MNGQGDKNLYALSKVFNHCFQKGFLEQIKT